MWGGEDDSTGVSFNSRHRLPHLPRFPEKTAKSSLRVTIRPCCLCPSPREAPGQEGSGAGADPKSVVFDGTLPSLTAPRPWDSGGHRRN